VAVLLVGYAERRASIDRDRPADPLTEEQAVGTAVDAAVAIVERAGLRDATGAYSVQSCTAEDSPYRVVVNMTFTVPQGNPPGYLDDVADAMTTLGWVDAATSAPHFGHKLVHDGSVSTFYRNTERVDLATMTVDGECRVVSTARRSAAWVDITERLRAAG
jgi:hypothetical protein